MKNYVITIMDNEKSFDAATRCIKSGAKYGSKIEMWKATTPKDAPQSIAKREGIRTDGFDEVYSRFENCLSAFLSHYSLWKECIRLNTPITIFEHDAVLQDAIPNRPFLGVLNIGEPSYGKFNQPRHIGVGPLTTKKYLPGAHAYQVTPRGAKTLVATAQDNRARPTDVYINVDLFPWIQEYFPFVAKADDSFTTIQVERGCIAKHNYNEDYEIERLV